MDKTKEMLTRQIETEIEKLSTMEDGSQEKAETIEGINKLYKLKLEDKPWFDKVKLGLEAASIVLPLMFYAVWMGRGFEFEKEGTYTSQTFRGMWNRFKPTK